MKKYLIQMMAGLLLLLSIQNWTVFSISAANPHLEKAFVATASNSVREEQECLPLALEVVVWQTDGNDYEYNPEIPSEGPVSIFLTANQPMDFYYKYVDLSQAKNFNKHHSQPHEGTDAINDSERPDKGWKALPDADFIELAQTMHRSYQFKGIGREVPENIMISEACNINIICLTYEPVTSRLAAGSEIFPGGWTNQDIKVAIDGGLPRKEMEHLAGYEYCLVKEGETLTEAETWIAVEYNENQETEIYLFGEFPLSCLWLRPVSIYGGRGPGNTDGNLMGIDRQAPADLNLQYGGEEPGVPDEDASLRFYSGSMEVLLQAADLGAGIAGFGYQLESYDKTITEGWVAAVEVNGLFQGSILIEGDFYGRLGISLKDKAGNWYQGSEYIYDGCFVVEKIPPQPPKLSLTISNEPYLGQWTNEDIQISVRDSGCFSGAAFFQYTKTDGALPDEDAVWQEIDALSLAGEGEGRFLVLLPSEGNFMIGADCNSTFFFRTISNSGQNSITSEGYKIRVQKTLPDNTWVSVSGEGRNSWFKELPEILLGEIPRAGEQISYSVYYKLWNQGGREPETASCFQKDGRLTGSRPHISQEGCYYLLVWTEDEAGNRSQESQDIREEIKVDVTPPVVHIAYEDNALDLYYSQGRTAILTIQEEHFSVADVTIIYYEDQEQQTLESLWQGEGEYAFYIDFMISEENRGQDGRYDFAVEVMDQAGNVTLSGRQRFIIDQSSPFIEALETEPDAPAWQHHLTGQIRSGASGLRLVKLIKDGQEQELLFYDSSNHFMADRNQRTQRLDLSIKENGVYTLGVESKAGVYSEIFLADYKQIDHIKPRLEIDKNGYDAGKWTSRPVIIEVDNTAGNLGNTIYYYKEGKNGSWEEFDGMLRIREDTELTYYFTAESEAQNQARRAGITAKSDSEYRRSLCDEKNLSVKADMTYPENLRVEYDYKEASSFLNALTFGFFFKDTLTVHLSAEDEMSGIKYFDVLLRPVTGEEESRRIYVDNPESGKGQVSFSIEPQFVGTLSAAATDQAGLSVPANGMNRYASFAVDAQAPTVPLVDCGDYIFGQWTNQDISLKIHGSTAPSGISGYEYTATQGGWPGEDAQWHEILPLEQKESTSLDPANVTAAGLSILDDTAATLFFRGISNTGMKGQMKPVIIHCQKTLPLPPAIEIESGNENGWYSQVPAMKIPSLAKSRIPMKYCYEITDVSGETEGLTGEIPDNNMPANLFREGEQKLRIWIEDEAGNRSPVQQDFIADVKLDMTAPVLQICANGRPLAAPVSYHNESMEIQVEISEANLWKDKLEVVMFKEDGQQIPLSVSASPGQTLQSTKLETGGRYTLTAQAMDLAGNMSTLYQYEIIIDKEAPAILVEGVQKQSANKEPVSLQIHILDDNLDLSRTKIVLSGTFTNIKETITLTANENGGVGVLGPLERDDLYSLRIITGDLAANFNEDSYVFSVNQNGPVIIFHPEEYAGSYVRMPFRPWIEIWDIDAVTILSVTLNGQEVPFDYGDGKVTFEEEIRKAGKYIVGMDVVDSAGNFKMMDFVEFYYDDIPPEIMIAGVEAGRYYHEFVEIRIIMENPEDFITSIKLNESRILPEAYQYDEMGNVIIRLSEAAAYRLEVSAEDMAGNRADSDILEFTIGNSLIRRWLDDIWRWIKAFL